MQKVLEEIGFIIHLIKLNLASSMEYRTSFLTQVFGMFLNNGIYFVFWIIFFNQFEEIRGYRINEIFLLFAVLTFGFGIAFTLAGNAGRIGIFVAEGRLDYYLTLPRSVLPHLLFSYMNPFTLGDLTFGITAYLFTGLFDITSIVLFVVCSLLVAVIFVSVFTIFGCLSFFIGNADQISFQLQMTMISIGLYPLGIFQGFIRVILYTLIPAAFVGAVPVEIIQTHNPMLFLGLVSATIISVILMITVFNFGLKRYESGSAILVNM